MVPILVASFQIFIEGTKNSNTLRNMTIKMKSEKYFITFYYRFDFRNRG